MAECKRLRSPDDVGPVCGCNEGACALGHTTPVLYEPTYTLNEYGLVDWVKPGRIDMSGPTSLVTVESEDGKLYYARLFVREDGLVYLRPGYESRRVDDDGA